MAYSSLHSKEKSIFVTIRKIEAMFIIFGAGENIKEQFSLAKSDHCFHCNNTTRWTATKVQKHISLFFMPVLPYKTKYYIACPICNKGQEVSEQEFERLRY